MSTVLQAQAADLDWVPVSSSNLQAIAYARDDRRLCVRFNNGMTGSYADVPESVYQGLLAAPSKGTFLAPHIKRGNQYVYTRVS